MKTTNYLYLEYRRTLRKFQKLQSRFERRITKGTLGEITARKRYFLVRKIEKLKEKLATLGKRMQLAGVAGAIALSGLALDTQAQVLAPKTKTYDRELLNDNYTGNQQDPSVAMNENGDIVSVWRDNSYDIRGKKINADGTEEYFDVIAGGDEGFSGRYPEVAIDGSGDFVVVWEQDQYPDGKTIQMEKFDGESLIGEGKVLVADTDDEYDNPKLDIALEEDGDVFVTYVDSYYFEEEYFRQVKLAKVADDLSISSIVVNQDTYTDYQGSYPSIDLDSNGNGVVVWDENLPGAYGDYRSIRYRNFQSDNLSSDTPGYLISGYSDPPGIITNMLRPDVEIDADGDLLISFIYDYNYAGDYEEIRIKKFDSEGVDQGLNIDVFSDNFNTLNASISSDNQGNFAVTYIDRSGVESVVTNRFTSSGASVDSFDSFQNPFSNYNPGDPSVSMNAKGDFAVVWSDDHDSQWSGFVDELDESGDASFISLYQTENAGHLILKEDNVAGADQFYDAKVSSNDDGDYVIAWADNTTGIYSIQAQRFTPGGKRIGSPFLIHTNAYEIYSIDIDLNIEDEFAIAWHDEYGVYKKIFDYTNNGSAVYTIFDDYHGNYPVSVSIDETGDFSVVAWTNYEGNSVMVNTGIDNTTNYQANEFTYSVGEADVAIGQGQNFTVVWKDTSYPDGLSPSDYPSIYSRRYTASIPVDPGQVLVANADDAVFGYDFPQVTASHESGDFLISYTDKYGPEIVGYNEQGSIIIPVFNPEVLDDYDLNLHVKVDMNSAGDFVVGWEGYDDDLNYGTFIKKYNISGEVILPEIFSFENTYDLSGIAIGKDKSIVTGYDNSEVIQTVIADPAPFEFSDSYEQIVNTKTTDTQHDAQIASNSSGDFVIVWQDDPYGSESIRAQVYNADGTEFGSEVIITDPSDIDVREPKVAMDNNGDIMVVWELGGGDYDYFQGQIFQKDGTIIRDDFDISADGISTRLQAYDVVSDPDGDFSVAWSSYYYFNYDEFGSEVYVRQFDPSTGDALATDQFLFETDLSNGEQIQQLVIEQNSIGDFAIAYHTDQKYYGDPDLMYIKTFDSNFTEDLAEQIYLGESPTGDGGVDDPLSITSDDQTGDFIVAHYIFYDDQVLVSKYTPGSPSAEDAVCIAIGDRPSVTHADNGDFVLVYQRSISGESTNVFTQRIDSNLEKVGSELKINDFDLSSSSPQVTYLGEGALASTWYSNNLDGDGGTIAKKVFYSFKPSMAMNAPAIPIVFEGEIEDFGFVSEYVVNNSSLEPVEFEVTSVPQHGVLEYDLGEPFDVQVGDNLSLEEAATLVFEHNDTENFTDSFSFILSNGTFESEEYTYDITIQPINDIPVFTKGADIETYQDTGENILSNWATGISDGDDGSQILTFELSNNNNDLFLEQPSIDASGNLSFTAVDGGFGTAEVFVSLLDDGGTEFGGEYASASQLFNITVLETNLAPSFTAGLDQEVYQDTGEQIINSWATDISDGNVAVQALTFELTNDNNDLFSEQPSIDASGNLSFTAAEGEFGTANVFVSLLDDGGTEAGGVYASDAELFIITVLETNLAPSFTIGPDQELDEDAGEQIINTWATDISDGNVEVQTMTFDVSNDNNDLFSVQPSIDEDGNLSFTAADNAHGTASVSVSLSDDGGIEFGGVDTSPSQTFDITVLPVNDLPEILVGIDDQNATEDEAFSFDVPSGTFTDEETGNLILTATQSDDSTLPAWLSFDGTTFSGTPVEGDTDVTVKVTAEDEGGLTVFDQFTITVTPTNDAPILSSLIPDQNATEDEAFSFDIPAGTFTDEESASLTLTATQSDDSALPGWLSFDGTTFSGTPGEGDTDVTVKVTAEDEGGLTVFDEFLLTVTAVNDAPVVAMAISDQEANQDEAFSFDVPVGTFSDIETASLNLTATQSDDTALPTWLSFDGVTFSGTPGEGDTDVIVKVTAEDEGGLTVSDEFVITVIAAGNTAPVVVTAISDQSATEDIAFSFTVPVGTFSDEETENLILSANQSDDSALPAWLSFDGTTFSGTPGEGDTDITVKVTAEDEVGLTVSDEFVLTVNPINDEPVVGEGIPDEVIFGYDAFSFKLPADAFFDIEGHQFTYDAKLDDGSDLPSFLSFNEETQTFSGQALINIDEGVYTIEVIATEDTEEEHTISTTFDLTIEAVLGTGDELSNSVSIYPNPASDKVTAKFENESMGTYQVQLIDQTGQILLADSFDKRTVIHEYQLDISTFNEGLYILRFNNENTSMTYKINKK